MKEVEVSSLILWPESHDEDSGDSIGVEFVNGEMQNDASIVFIRQILSID